MPLDREHTTEVRGRLGPVSVEVKGGAVRVLESGCPQRICVGMGAKRRTGEALGSRALIADSKQTRACWYLSVVALAGLVANAVFGWWWADPLAALGIALLLVREGLEAVRGEADD